MDKYKSYFEKLMEELQSEGRIKTFSLSEIWDEKDFPKAELKGNMQDDCEGIYLPPLN